MTSSTPRRIRGGRRRRSDETPLLTWRDRTESRATTRRGILHVLPAPSWEGVIGVVALLLIAAAAIHLSQPGAADPVATGAQPATVGAGTEPDPAPAGEAPLSNPAATEIPKSGEAASTAPPAAEAVPSAGAGGPVLVHISGQVAEPGVVELPAGARVQDAVDTAGGPTEKAQLHLVNLARPVSDGEQIHIPALGEEPPPAGAPGTDAAAGGGDGGAPASKAPGGGLVNINTATAAQLDELPGVGPAIAQRIIDHREQNGPFTQVDDLELVSGIGPATLEKLRDQVTV